MAMDRIEDIINTDKSSEWAKHKESSGPLEHAKEALAFAIHNDAWCQRILSQDIASFKNSVTAPEFATGCQHFVQKFQPLVRAAGTEVEKLYNIQKIMSGSDNHKKARVVT